MSPAFSVIFFTVSSGAGYGLFMILAIMAPLAGLDNRTSLWAAGIALLLITSGLLSSVGHLANPKNAWRAFSRFRTSWLSREGVLAVAFYPFAMLYMYLLYVGNAAGVYWILLSVAVLALSFAIVFSTGMIYACLKTIPNWYTPLVPAGYIAMAFSTGGLLFIPIRLGTEHVVTNGQLSMIILLLVIALILKLIYYARIGRPSSPTPNTATGFHHATVRLLDVGHSSGTFLTEEFGYSINADLARAFRFGVVGLAFLLPVLLLVLMMLMVSMTGGQSLIIAMLAVAAGLAGVFLERWLFFAEARHCVTLYHGAEAG